MLLSGTRSREESQELCNQLRPNHATPGRRQRAGDTQPSPSPGPSRPPPPTPFPQKSPAIPHQAARGPQQPVLLPPDPRHSPGSRPTPARPASSSVRLGELQEGPPSLSGAEFCLLLLFFFFSPSPPLNHPRQPQGPARRGSQPQLAAGSPVSFPAGFAAGIQRESAHFASQMPADLPGVSSRGAVGSGACQPPAKPRRGHGRGAPAW